jgi:hypothetical protein
MMQRLSLRWREARRDPVSTPDFDKERSMPTITLKDRDYSKVRWQELRGDYPELKASGMGEALDLIKPFFAKGAAAVEAYQLGDAKTKAKAVMTAITKALGKADKIKDSSKKQGAKDLLAAYTKGIKEFVAELDQATQKEQASQKKTDQYIQDLEAKKKQQALKLIEDTLGKEAEELAAQLADLNKLPTLRGKPAGDLMTKHPALNDAFTAFLKSEFSAENIEFLNSTKNPTFSAVTAPNDPKANVMAQMKKLIYERHVPQGAPKEINIPATMRAPLVALAGASNFLAMDFTDARDELSKLVGQDGFPRFLTRPEFKAAFKQAQDHVTKQLSIKETARAEAIKKLG